MKYEVLIAVSAEADLEEAYAWHSEQAPKAAVEWYNGVLDAFLTLETFPDPPDILGISLETDVFTGEGLQGPQLRFDLQVSFCPVVDGLTADQASHSNSACTRSGRR